MATTPVTEPVGKEHQALYVQGSQDYHWLSEHGLLKVTAMFLANLRRETEQEEAVTARLEAARDAAKERAGRADCDYTPQAETVPVTGDRL